MPQLWKSATKSVAFGSFLLMRIPTAAWKSRAYRLGFPTFPTGPATVYQYGTNFHSKNYKGQLRRFKNITLPNRNRRSRGGSSRQARDLPRRADIL
jgi:hypothetical protein